MNRSKTEVSPSTAPRRPRAPDRERGRGQPFGPDGGDPAAEDHHRSPPARARAERARATSARRWLSPRPGARGIRAEDSAVGDLATLALPFLERLGATNGRDGEHRHPDSRGRRAPRTGRQQSPLGAGNWVGRRIPIHASSMGKVFMAFGAAQPPFGRLARLGPQTITSLETLFAELDRVRRDGYATTWGSTKGLCSAAAPCTALAAR